MVDRRLKPIICTARTDILDRLARAADEGRLKLPVSEIVPLSDGIGTLTALEHGRKSNGKVLVRVN